MKEKFRGVVLITVDSLRADHMSCYGYHRNTTPFLDKYVKENRFYLNGVSAGPSTATTFPALLSSTYFTSYPYKKLNKRWLPPDRKLISELLPSEVATAAFHSNPFISSFYGYHRGFDVFHDYLITDSTVNAGIAGKIKRSMEITLGKPPFVTGEQINEDSLHWIKSTEDKFFLWNHYMEPHMPYLPPKEYIDAIGVEKVGHLRKLILGQRLNKNYGENLRDEDIPVLIDLYDACIRHTDDILRQFINSLPKDVAILITADHGEAFGEHGFLGHQAYLYDELIHVPMILSAGKGAVPSPVSHLDIVPTILDLQGHRIPNRVMGDSLLKKPEREGVISEVTPRNMDIISYRGTDFKYIRDDLRAKEEFYDLKNDPGEQDNLIGEADVSYHKRVVNEHIEKQRKHRSRLEMNKITGKISDLNI